MRNEQRLPDIKAIDYILDRTLIYTLSKRTESHHADLRQLRSLNWKNLIVLLTQIACLWLSRIRSLVINPRTDGGLRQLSTDGGGRMTAPPPEISRTKQDSDKR